MSTYTRYQQLYYYRHKKKIQKRTAAYRKEWARKYYEAHKEEIRIKRREQYLKEKASREANKAASQAQTDPKDPNEPEMVQKEQMVS